MSIAKDALATSRIVRKVIRRRRVRRELATLLADTPPLPADTFRVAVYFADKTVNLYQIRQWYEPLRRLAEQHPVVVISRSLGTTRRLLEECPLPVVYAPTIGEIENFVDEQDLKMVLYVNQNMRNFQMMRFPSVFHVFISHGESEKIYMSSNQAKAYDYCFVAGEAAVQRISQRLLDFDSERRLLRIGRPQIDVAWPGPDLPQDGRTTVLYAPTWEGDRPSMSYSSVGTHGPDLVRALTATGTHRVVYRPHPRTGVFDRGARAAHRLVKEILAEANERDPGAAHLTDVESPFGWHLQAADVCICDISAVAFDWLATGKPIVLTEPAAPDAEVDRSGIAGALPLLTVEDAPETPRVLDEAREAARGGRFRERVELHFGDTTPGSSMERFLAACQHVMDSRDRAMTMLSPSPVPVVPAPRSVDVSESAELVEVAPSADAADLVPVPQGRRTGSPADGSADDQTLTLC